MAGFDRSKIQATSQQALNQQEKEQAAARPSRRRSTEGIEYHEVDEGANVFRIYPFHPDGGGKSFTEAKSVVFLPIEQPKKDDKGNVIEGEKEVKLKPIFNAKVHGGLDKDAVEEYLAFVKNVVLQDKFGDDDDKKKQFWNKVIGYKDKQGKYHAGLKYQDTWVLYADKFIDGQWVFGQVEVKKSVKGAMLKAAMELNTPDPFTNPDEGIPVVITKDSNAGKADPNNYYSAKIQSTVIKGQGGKITTEYVPVPLSDEQLSVWADQTPLYKKFKNAFTYKDFMYQLEGLERFDKLKGIGVFDYEEFASILEEISKQVPPDKEEPKEQKQKAQPSQQSAKSATPKKTSTIPAKQPDPEVEDQYESEDESYDNPAIDQDEEGQNVEQIKASVSTNANADRLAKLKNKSGLK